MRITYAILELMNSEGIKSKVKALTQVEIIEQLANKKNEHWSERTIYNKLRQASKDGYISEGLRRGNSKTFYINANGLAHMENLKLSEIEEIEEVKVEDKIVEKTPLDYEYFIKSLGYSKYHFESIENLLKCENDNMMEVNQQTLLSSINLIIDTLQELKDNL